VVLIVLFLTILSTSLLPVRLLDAAWQLRVGGALINASPFPLIGLVLLHVAANLQRQQSQALASSSGLRRATERLQQMRQVVSSASSIPELEQRLAPLDGPRLDAADRSLPLPVLRSRIASLLDQAAARFERARSSAPPASPWALVVPILITFGNSVNRRKPKTNSGGDGLVGWNSRGLCLLARAGPPAIATHQPAGSNLPAGSIHRHRQAGTLTCQPGELLVTPHR
jgi:hypothetical protein